MSHENVEIVRRAFDAFNRRDLGANLGDVHPEIRLDWSRSRGPDAGIYRGSAAFRGFWNTFFETFDEVTSVAEEFIEVGDHVVVPNRAFLRGRDGIKVEAHSVAVVTIRSGRIVLWALYQDKAEALEAVGLSE